MKKESFELLHALRRIKELEAEREQLILDLVKQRRQIKDQEARISELEKPLPDVPNSSPRIEPPHTPSPEYLNDEMPTYNIPDLIEHLEFRIQIHETYAGLVVQNPSQYPPRIYGNYEYQLWAIDGYRNACYWLRRLIPS